MEKSHYQLKQPLDKYPYDRKFVKPTEVFCFDQFHGYCLRGQILSFKVILPHPTRFVLHKLIISQRRKDKDKAQKDDMMALEILHDLIEVGEKEAIRLAYDDLHTQWQKRVVTGLEFVKQEAILSELKRNS